MPIFGFEQVNNQKYADALVVEHWEMKKESFTSVDPQSCLRLFNHVRIIVRNSLEIIMISKNQTWKFKTDSLNFVFSSQQHRKLFRQQNIVINCLMEFSSHLLELVIGYHCHSTKCVEKRQIFMPISLEAENMC